MIYQNALEVCSYVDMRVVRCFDVEKESSSLLCHADESMRLTRLKYSNSTS